MLDLQHKTTAVLKKNVTKTIEMAGHARLTRGSARRRLHELVPCRITPTTIFAWGKFYCVTILVVFDGQFFE